MNLDYALNVEKNLGYNHVWLMIGKGAAKLEDTYKVVMREIVPLESTPSLSNMRAGFFPRLREIIEDLGYVGHGRQSRLASHYGLSQPSVRKWLDGVAMPDYAICADLCMRSGFSFDWLMTGRGGRRTNGESRTLETDIQMSASMLKKMDVRSRSFVIQIMEAITGSYAAKREKL